MEFAVGFFGVSDHEIAVDPAFIFKKKNEITKINIPTVFFTACSIQNAGALFSTGRLTAARVILPTRLIFPLRNPFSDGMITSRLPSILQATYSASSPNEP